MQVVASREQGLEEAKQDAPPSILIVGTVLRQEEIMIIGEGDLKALKALISFYYTLNFCYPRPVGWFLPGWVLFRLKRTFFNFPTFLFHFRNGLVTNLLFDALEQKIAQAVQKTPSARSLYIIQGCCDIHSKRKLRLQPARY